jgi:hypothetical protein
VTEFLGVEIFRAGTVLGWGPGIWALSIAACLVAGVVRGFTGFGLALIVVTAVSVLAAPAEIVPIAVILDLFAGIRMISHVHKDVDRPGVVLMTLGAIPMIPLGVWLLSAVHEDHMRLSIGIVVLTASLAIAAGLGLKRPPGRFLKVITGCAVGLMTGAAGIPGPPVILLYLSSPLPPAMLRATAVAIFLVTDTMVLILLAIKGLLTIEVLLHCLILIPFVEVAVILGRRLHGKARPEAVKNAALALLMLLAIVAIGRVLLT